MRSELDVITTATLHWWKMTVQMSKRRFIQINPQMDCKNIMHKIYMGETLKTFEIFKRGKKIKVDGIRKKAIIFTNRNKTNFVAIV